MVHLLVVRVVQLLLRCGDDDDNNDDDNNDDDNNDNDNDNDNDNNNDNDNDDDFGERRLVALWTSLSTSTKLVVPWSE